MTMPNNRKLKPIYKELTFWVLLFISVPGLASAYYLAWQGLTDGGFDQEAFLMSVLGCPIALYLGIGRQYVRGQAVGSTTADELAYPEEFGATPPQNEVDRMPLTPRAQVVQDELMKADQELKETQG